MIFSAACAPSVLRFSSAVLLGRARYAIACALALCAALPVPARAEAFNVTDSVLQAHASVELPPHARFVVRQVAGENFSGPKIARMLQMQMVRQGYTHDPAS